MSRDERPATVPELERRLSELGNLYEVARSLLGARDGAHVASRIVLAAMGTFGARAGALYVAGERDRLSLAFAYGEGITTGEAGLRLDAAARAALEGRGALRFGGTTPRALAPLREKLEARHGAEAIAAVEGPDGPAGLLVLGPRLTDDPYDDADLDTLEAIAGLARLALGARGHAVAARAAAPARSAARRLAALRGAHPALRAIVGDSETLAETFEDLVAVAASRVPVLIAGESGVGKELAARAIHEMSDRAGGPFEVVDCGSIPRELIESELFGHVRGSFTGAHRDRRGAFEVAHRGTLFLDEIGEMPLQLQTRLLRVLQEGRFRRVGDERPIDTDVRVLAASNRDLRAEVEGGRFRQDLFFRLNVYPIRLPPLRERLEDLPALVAHFLPAGRGAAPALEPEALEALRRHSWPGNIRELGNFCAALAVRARGGDAIDLDTVERAWRRQYPGDPPWLGEAPAAPPRGRLGGWALEQARAARFNLVEAARALQRRKRRGESVPVTERSALSYYVTGEILRALGAHRGDLSKVAAVIAGDEDLVPRVRSRIDKVVEALHACGDERAARRKFAKLPGGYEAHVVAAFRAVTR